MTVRETYVMAKALAYAIKTIEALPRRWQEYSDKEDMKLILHKHFSVFEPIVIGEVEHHLNGAKIKWSKEEI
jgi:hypothetical protein